MKFIVKVFLIIFFVYWEFGFLLNISKYKNTSSVITAVILVILPILIYKLLKRRNSSINDKKYTIKMINYINKQNDEMELIPSGDSSYLNTLLPDGKTIKQAQIDGFKESIIYKKNSANPKFHRTEDDDDELSSCFYHKFQKTISLAEDKLFKLANSISSDNLDEEVIRTKKTIAHYEQFREFCYSHGKGGQIYFDDMWEHCHNSKNPDFSYIEYFENHLDKLEMRRLNIDEHAIIRSKLIEFIKANDGIKQSNIYKEFEPDYKHIIRSVLMDLEKYGIITRVKKGNTYELHIK
jgi:hypothetical protein